MEKEITKEPPEIIKKESSMFKPKILLIGLPIFIVQLVAVYFITANILLSGSSQSGSQNDESKTEELTEEAVDGHSGESKDGTTSENGASGLIFSVEDMIVNPAQTNGKMLLLASLGLSVENEESKKALEEKQVIVKDAIIGVLSSKNVTQLKQYNIQGHAKNRNSKKTYSSTAGLKSKQYLF